MPPTEELDLLLEIVQNYKEKEEEIGYINYEDPDEFQEDYII